MEPITITLDGSEVSGHAGMTVLDLATEVGIEIPTLCYDSHLSPLGACRVCLVEEVASGRLVASCVTPISRGMVIDTRSKRVIDNRRVVVELMLASHPDSCIVCDKGNRCALRKIAADLGLGFSSLERIPSYHPLVDLNPFIQRDLSKCIRCGRCIRADQEIAVVGAIDYTDRGFEARPATLLDAPLEQSECNFCGICVSICPTGALSERNRISTTTASHATRTTCALCGAGCAILLEHRGSLVLGTRPAGDKNSVNHISLCVKGHYGLDFINSGERLTTPLIRRQGELVPAGWDEALDLVAGRFAELKDAGGGRSLGAIGGSRSSNEEGYLLQKFVRQALGSDNVDSGARLRGSALSAGIERVLGRGAMTHPLSHILDAAEILVVGANPLATNPIVGQRIKQAVKFRGAHLVLVDPLPGGLSGFAGTWLRPAPGTYPWFLAGLLREVLLTSGSAGIEEGGRAGAGLRGIQKTVEPYTSDRVEDLTGLPARLVRDTARRLAVARSIALIPGSGVARDEGASFSGSLLAALALLTDNVARPGCGLFPISGSLNDQGAEDMGVSPGRLPGYASASDAGVRAGFEQAWGAPLPQGPGLDYLSMIEAAERGELVGLHVVGENPAAECPDSEKTMRALSRLKFLVVQDLFLTETASLAHVVLPSASFAEKDGTFTSLERRVQRNRRALGPVGQSRPDWQILLELASRLGGGPPKDSPSEVWREINDLVPLYRGITEARLMREPEGIFWPCSGEEDPGTPVLYGGGSPQIPADLVFPTLPDFTPETRDGYPLWLLTTESLFHSSDGVQTFRSRALLQAAKDGSLVMNPFDAGSLGIGDGDSAVLISPKGRLRTKVTFSQEVPRGIVTAATAPSHLLAGLFSMSQRDPETGSPQMHRQMVRVEAQHVAE